MSALDNQTAALVIPVAISKAARMAVAGALDGDFSIAPAVVSCADVRHEVVESLRWARHLIASGIARPNEIAIASANTTARDNHFLACDEGTGFRLHFSHGVATDGSESI